MEHDKSAILANTDLFRSLGKRQLRKLADAGVVLEHPAGTPITDEGDKGISFHVIVEGTATVSVGGEQRAELGPGQYFGEIAVLDGKPRTATVTAKSDLTTLAIGIWNLTPIFLSEPSVMQAMVQALCARIRTIEEVAGAKSVQLPQARGVQEAATT